MLWGLLGVVIPIVIHLLQQRQLRVVPWAATMQFVLRRLKATAADPHRGLAPGSLIRGACPLSAFALARPFPGTLRTDGSSASAARTRFSWSIEVSAWGTSTHSRGVSIRPRRSPRRSSPGAAEGDAFVLPGSPVIRRGSSSAVRIDQEDLLEEVERLPCWKSGAICSRRCGGSPRCFRQTAEAEPQGSDRPHGPAGETWLPANPTLRSQCGELLRDIAATGRPTIVDVGPEAAENAAVASLSSTRSLTTPGGTLDLDVELSSSARSARHWHPARRSRSTASSAPPGDGRPDPAATMTRSVRVSAESGQDRGDRARDQRRSAEPSTTCGGSSSRSGGRSGSSSSMGARPVPRTRSSWSWRLAPPEVSTSPPVFRLQILPQTVPISRFREQALEEIDCILLCDVRSLTSEKSARLETFVRGGGGLVLAHGRASRRRCVTSARARLSSTARAISRKAACWRPGSGLPRPLSKTSNSLVDQRTGVAASDHPPLRRQPRRGTVNHSDLPVSPP